ncbi:MAG: Fic family protein [Erysipelotrichaceae bacterium]|nr:Fic family protein [Erysipelotrichaceae bacterium]
MGNINKLLSNTFENLSSDEEKIIVDALCKRFLIEHKKNDKSGIYSLTQSMMAYNSNRMEGSTLTEEQTKNLFLTGTLPQSDGIYIAKDIEEATGHFLMFNEMIHNYKEPLTEEIIKKYHYRLKAGVFEDMANGYPCGEYKNRKNFVSDITTSTPDKVEKEIQQLLKWYHSTENNLKNIVKFHVIYENIHPFCDGNGRTGRMILFKECIKNGIIPPIISSDRKMIYNQALNKAQKTDDVEELFNIVKEAQSNYYNAISDYLYIYEKSTDISTNSEDESDFSM